MLAGGVGIAAGCGGASGARPARSSYEEGAATVGAIRGAAATEASSKFSELARSDDGSRADAGAPVMDDDEENAPLIAASTSIVEAAEPLPGASERTAPLLSCTGAAVVLLLDRSASMSGLPLHEGLGAASAAVDALGPADCFELVAFDEQPERVVPLANVVRAGAMKAAIARVRVGGGTDLARPLRAARDAVTRASHARRKLVLLVTDGQAPSNGLRALAEGIALEGAKLTTIGLGSGVDEGQLRSLADSARGRFYKVVDPTRLTATVRGELARQD